METKIRSASGRPLRGRLDPALPVEGATLAPIMNKLYFKIGEVARLAGVEPYVLRYWETEFREIRPIKSRTNQRLYRRKDVERVLKIRGLLYNEGYTIDGARRKMREFHRSNNGRSLKAIQLPLHFEPHRLADRQVLGQVRQELEEILKILEG